ncbi:MAG: hypothetical protein ACUZ8I_10375, partial [Candidatus Scalindua sp.]
MATNDFSDIENEAGFLKRKYGAVVKDQENLMTGIWPRIKDSGETPHGAGSPVAGGGHYFSIRKSGNWGIAPGTENATLPTARAERAQQMIVYPAQIRGRIRLTGLNIESSKQGDMSFRTALADEMAMVGDRMLKLANYFAYRDAFGILGFTASAAVNSSDNTQVDLTMASPDYHYGVFVGMFLDICAQQST